MNKSTKRGSPWIVVYKCDFDSRAEAMQLELKIKKRGASRYLADLNSAVG